MIPAGTTTKAKSVMSFGLPPRALYLRLVIQMAEIMPSNIASA
jgi:hypothetical protein